jgi:hypothetical protein
MMPLLLVRMGAGMPHFVKVGPFKGNPSGVGARGWRIWRRGKVVHREWGRIEVIHARPARFLWAFRPQYLRQQFRSPEAAATFVQRMILEQERPDRDGSYRRLPTGVYIKVRPVFTDRRR